MTRASAKTRRINHKHRHREKKIEEHRRAQGLSGHTAAARSRYGEDHPFVDQAVGSSPPVLPTGGREPNSERFLPPLPPGNRPAQPGSSAQRPRTERREGARQYSARPRGSEDAGQRQNKGSPSEQR
jgi:hypothetical protein